MAPLAALVRLLALLHLVAAKTMNDGTYRIANPVATKDGSPGYSTDYGDAEYFDVYSPLISSYYSEVIWGDLDEVKLPDNILKRFANKTIAIIGYEIDQVKILPDGTEVPVPITHAYNHHYLSSMWNSERGKMVKVANPSQYGSHHGPQYEFQYHSPEDGPVIVGGVPIPSDQGFFEGNGGEMRLSYHGYPKGYAQLLYNPTTWKICVMQIDTWNREEPSPKFKPGPLPKTSPIYNDSTATYSGLLECPCNDKMWASKEYYRMYLTMDNCDASRVENATMCWEGSRFVAPAAEARTHELKNDTSKPPDCSVMIQDDGSVDMYWNEMPSHDDAVDKRIRQDSTKMVGYVSNSINASVALTDIATLTLTGPADAWFGMAFGATTMCKHDLAGDECPDTDGGPYAIIVSGDSVEERNLGFHGKGTVIPPTVQVVSNTVNGGNRTVVVTRPLQGADGRYFSFDSGDGNSYRVPVIVARGCSLPFAQHCGHGAIMLHILKEKLPMPVCKNGVFSQMGGKDFKMDGRCPPEASSLFEQSNPTCFLDTYQGGLSCCRHKHSLLDSDQEIPWKDQKLEYHMKMRYYFEDYKPATDDVKNPSHANMLRMYRQTESFAGEYDVVQCPSGTPPSQCVHQITARFSVLDFQKDCGHPEADGINLIYAGPHCHAPSCLSMELYNEDTGQLLCRSEPIKGQSTDKVYDEHNYIAIPPCLWGHEEGLMDPIFLPTNTTLLAVKRNNNTLLHTGEMASWQCRGVVVNKKAANKDMAQAVNAEAKSSQNEMAEDDKEEVPKRTAVRKGRPEV